MKLSSVWDSIELSKEVFRSLIITSNHAKININEIGWLNYSPGIFKNLYAKEYEIITKNRQYSFLLSQDKGCIQFYYYYENEILKKVKLAYYPFPLELRETKEQYEKYFDDYDNELIGEYYFDILNIITHQFNVTTDDEALNNLVKQAKELGNYQTPESLILGQFEAKYKCTNSSHIRIDYDANVTTHNKCEMQIGAINNIRMPMHKLITPFMFMDFICKNLYPKEYDDIIMKSSFITDFAMAKKGSFEINPFKEANIFMGHS